MHFSQALVVLVATAYAAPFPADHSRLASRGTVDLGDGASPALDSFKSFQDDEDNINAQIPAAAEVASLTPPIGEPSNSAEKPEKRVSPSSPFDLLEPVEAVAPVKRQAGIDGVDPAAILGLADELNVPAPAKRQTGIDGVDPGVAFGLAKKVSDLIERQIGVGGADPTAVLTAVQDLQGAVPSVKRGLSHTTILDIPIGKRESVKRALSLAGFNPDDLVKELSGAAPAAPVKRGSGIPGFDPSELNQAELEKTAATLAANVVKMKRALSLAGFNPDDLVKELTGAAPAPAVPAAPIKRQLTPEDLIQAAAAATVGGILKRQLSPEELEHAAEALTVGGVFKRQLTPEELASAAEALTVGGVLKRAVRAEILGDPEMLTKDLPEPMRDVVTEALPPGQAIEARAVNSALVPADSPVADALEKFGGVGL